jgi:hypothetical protein
LLPNNKRDYQDERVGYLVDLVIREQGRAGHCASKRVVRADSKAETALYFGQG